MTQSDSHPDLTSGFPTPVASLERSLLLHRLLHVLWKRKWTAVILFGFVVLGVCFFTWLTSPTWTGTAYIALEGQPKPQWNLSDDLATASPPTPGEASVQNLVTLLGSESMADSVVHDFELAELARIKAEKPGNPRDKIKKAITDTLLFPLHKLQDLGILSDDKNWQDTATSEFLKDWLTVGAVEGTQVIAIRVDAPSIKLSEAVPNRMVELLQERLDAFRRAELQGPYEQVVDEAQDVRQELAQARERLRQLQDDRGVLDLDETRAARIRNLEDLKLDEATARDDAETQARRLANVREQLEAQAPTMVSAVTEEVNPALALLRDQLAALEVERAGLSARRTESDRSFQVLNNQIDELRRRMADEELMIVKSRTEGPDPTYLSLATRAASLEADVFAAAARVEGLAATRETLVSEMASMSEDELLFTDLEQEIAILSSIASGLQRKQREMEALLDEPPAEVALRVTPAINYEFAKADWPIWPLNIIVALFLGTALGLGWPLFSEFWRDTFATPLEAELALATSVLAAVPRIRVRSGRKGRWRSPAPKHDAALSAAATALRATPGRVLLLAEVDAEGATHIVEALAPWMADEPARTCVFGAFDTSDERPAEITVLEPASDDASRLAGEEESGGVHFLPFGDAWPLADEARFNDVILHLRSHYDNVLIGPLASGHPLALLAARHCDGVVWCVATDQTRRARTVAARRRLDPDASRTRGCLLVDHRTRVPRVLRHLFHLDES